MRKSKIQSGRVIIDKDAVAGIYEKEIVQLAQGYNVLNGIEVYVTQDSAQAFIGLGLKDDSGILVDKLPIKSYEANDSVSPSMKQKPVSLFARNQVIIASVELLAANDGVKDLIIDFGLHLVNDPQATSCE